MASEISFVRAGDGTPLLMRYWPGAPDAAGVADAAGAPRVPWASVVLVHGLGEHGGRYEHVGDQLHRAGIAVSAYDHRPFGGSKGPRADLERWEDLLDDLATIAYETSARAAGVALAMYGHSFGGLVVTDYLLAAGRPLPALAVLSAPGLEDCLAGWKHALAPLLARILPRLRIANGVDPESLARDRSDSRLYGPDPLAVGSSTMRFGAATFAAQARMRAAVRRVDDMPVPTLVLHGADDTLVPTRASEPFERLANARRIVYPGLRHELHNEPEGPRVVSDVVDWLRGRVAVIESRDN